MSKRIIIDTGFWHALFNPHDQYHDKAEELLTYLELGEVVIPYPTMYETINTDFAGRKNRAIALKEILSKSNVRYIYDDDYRDIAINMAFDSCLNKGWSLSLVDTIIRLMIDDVNIRINYLISFNVGDFADVCKKRNVEILYL